MKPEYQEPNIDPKLLAPYNPTETERRIYKMWEDSGLFNPDICVEKGYTAPDAKPYSIIMPPPNATGTLHMGHALGLTVQDIFTRYKRMNGFRTLLLPGTDHASIATQSKVEKEIQKNEKKSRHDLGREEMLRRIDEFVAGSRKTITEQTKIIGTSCDWSREAFTLDKERNIAVNTLFKKMYDDGLIYRGHRIVNWDPKGQTTIADDEIVYEERKAKLYTFKYSKDFPIAISTTRPETKIGDTAVAVNPDDTRYKDLVGKEYDLEFCGVQIHIKIIADKEVDMEFGTGALGVTPAHSIIDWEIADRHNLPRPQVINEYAKMMLGDERLLGKKTTEAREIIVEWLRSESLLEKEEDITQNISTAERTGGIVEPLPKLQWFVAVNKKIPGKGKTLKDIMREAVADKKITILPEHFEKTYFHWIENLRDWCISRQIWYGHRIPVWYRSTDAHGRQNGKSSEIETYCGTTAPEGEGWEQDADTLDTWFSSGTWTFSTLGWPNQTKDLETYHPTSLMIHAYEILFFWSARMILMTGYVLDTVPFHTLYLTGVIRDNQGRKFSKSLGNGIDPIEIAEKFGSDAGRMALIIGAAAGTDSKIDENKIKGYKNFANKLWNITRFILSYQEGNDAQADFSQSVYEKEQYEAWQATLADVTTDIENFRLHLASEKLYHYSWHTFADILLEDAKAVFLSDDQHAKNIRFQFLITLWKEVITALHPFIPFVTEEIWSLLPKDEQEKDAILMVSVWPSQRINKQ
ncbi:MAG: valine--tRNA ligase [bacterium]